MSPRTRVWTEKVYLALLAALLVMPLAVILRWFYEALPFPYALDYNEGIVWKQMIEIVAGHGYAPIDRFPAIVFHYPPVFHWVTAGLAATGIDPLIAGRIVSLASTAGSAIIIGDLSRRGVNDARPVISGVAMVAGIVTFILCEAVHTWAPQMRVDPIACFFAFAGIWCVTQSGRLPALVYLAAICFVASVFSKQVSIVAPAASFGALLLVSPRRALVAIAATIVLGSIVLAALVWQTDGGVLRHLFLYNINRFEFARLLPNLRSGTSAVDRLVLAIGTLSYFTILGTTWIARKSGRKRDLTITTLLLFVPISTLSLITTSKFGSSNSYYMQWEGGLAIFAALGIAWLVKNAFDSLKSEELFKAAAFGAIPLLFAGWALVHRDGSHLYQLRILQSQDPQIVALLAPAKGEIISDDMAMVLRLHRDVVWEPAIFAELARQGRWDERLIIAAFHDHKIGAVMSDGDKGYRYFDERYNPAVRVAMDEALPRKIMFGRRVVHLPALDDTASGTPMPAGSQK